MSLKSSVSVLFLFTIYLCGVILFMFGFFPFASNEDDYIVIDSDFPTSVGINPLNRSLHYKKRYTKGVLMVIDAMRFDFVHSHSMKYVNEKIANDEACLFKLKVEVPTVTLPRIKSLTTGTISNFIDVILNFGSSELQSDSLIYQMHRRGDRIVFCGDNTWAKLFPGKFYKEYVNNESFFVQDFFTGDKQITQQVIKELDHHNWDFLILHYLGLDHIGHVEGPFGSKIPLKLTEMNEVIRKIHSNIDDKTLLLVTADHGMRDTGGHGGNSIPEIMVPFLCFGESCKANREIIYNQIDITPTLSVLFGVSIPTPSIGCIIPELIDFLPLEDQLYALFYNNVRLLTKIGKEFKYNSVKNPDYLTYHKSGIKFHQAFLKSINDKTKIKHFGEAKGNYINSTKLLSQLLSSELVQFDMFSIALGITFATMGTSLIIWATFFLYTYPKLTLKLRGIASILILLATGCVLQIFLYKLLSLHSRIGNLNILGASLFVLIVFILGIWRFSLSNKLEVYYKKPPYLFVGIIAYTMSLQGSSFIEEEHQTWYYTVTTVLLYFCINELRAKENNLILEKFKEKSELINDTSSNIMPCCYNIFDSVNFNKTTKCDKSQNRWSMVQSGFRWIFFMTMHVFMKRLNRTGDKWIHLPDIGDWLNSDKHKIELNVFCLLALVLSFATLWSFIGRWTKILSFVATILIYYFRSTTGLFPFYKTNTKFPLFLFLLCIIAITLINYIGAVFNLFIKQKNHLGSVKSLLGTNVAVYGLISMLLHKPHNIILVPGCIITLKVAFSACDTTYKMGKELLAHKVILAIWIGRMFFFYQGNSNNLASIDLNPGFIGLDKYNFYISGSLITLNTFFGPLCSTAVLLYETFDENDIEKNKKKIPRIFLLMCLITAFPTSVYLFLMVIFRSHLFIWSVFSPKLLYEAFTSALQYVVLILLYIFYKVLRVI